MQYRNSQTWTQPSIRHAGLKKRQQKGGARGSGSFNLVTKPHLQVNAMAHSPLLSLQLVFVPHRLHPCQMAMENANSTWLLFFFFFLFLYLIAVFADGAVGCIFVFKCYLVFWCARVCVCVSQPRFLFAECSPCAWDHLASILMLLA